MSESEPTPEPTTATAEQVAAVNKRLDQLDAAQKRSANRARSANAPLRIDPPPVFRNMTLSPEMLPGCVPEAARADKAVAGMLERTVNVARETATDLEWLTQSARHFSEMTAGLLAPGETSQRLLATTFGAEADKFASKLKRITGRIEQLDKEATQLEKDEKTHADAARQSLRADMAPHVASEIRQWLRSMPDDAARSKALHDAVAAGDRELLHAISERGVPPQVLGFRDRKMFDHLIGYAENKFGPEHVARREAAAALKEKVKALRTHLQKSSDTTCGLGMLERWPVLANVVREARLA